jgi:hypothetical protein
MEKEYAVLELGNKSCKLMVGYMLDDKVDVLYRGTFKLSVPLKDGDVFDMGSLINDLSKLKKVQDKEHFLTLNISEVVLIYPPIGIEVYEASRATNTISNVSKVDKIDIVNALEPRQKIEDTEGKQLSRRHHPDDFLYRWGQELSPPAFRRDIPDSRNKG